MKRKNLIIIILAVICAVSLLLVACKKHEHTFSQKWSFDATHHWHAATCEHSDEKSDYAQHNLENNRCAVCGYEGAGFSWTNSTSGGTGSSAVVMPTNIPAAATEPSLMIHYYRTNSADYKTWGYWLWAEGADGSLYNIQYQDETNEANASVTIVALSSLNVTPSGAIGMIPRLQADWVKDGDADRNIDLSQYPMDSNNYIHLYIVQGSLTVYKTEAEYNSGVLSLSYGLNAEFTSETRIAITTASPINKVAVYEGETLLAEKSITSSKNVAYNFENGKKMDFAKDYTVKVTYTDGEERQCSASIMKLYSSEAFDTTYYYDGELGAIYTQDATEFKVWSPVSSRIVLNLYEKGNGGNAYDTKEMTRGDKGVFSVTVTGDLGEKYYTYTVYNATYPAGQEIVDPYAKSAGLNGVRGQIVNFAETNPEGWDEVTPRAYDANELTVWETHVADVTSSETWQGTESNRYKFLGMIEKGTTYSDGTTTVTTGFDHIKELGVNAVQLVPIYDQAGNDEANKSFNWGYNPLNYNVLEGGYATNAYDGYVRIREFKQLVQAFNGEDINIIMDVVYNHVNAAAGSNFDVLMPGYYFRYSSSGALLNGSGCGNETASDRSMYRKFMIDSVCFWAKEYKLGGFRFDLMALHDLDTMNQLAAELKKINPSIVVYGEPWAGGSVGLLATQTANQSNAMKYVGYGQFNDQMRDTLIMGGMKAATEKGWAMGGNPGTGNIVNGLKGFTGSSITDMYKTVNYVTCHDNYTLYDRAIATGQFGNAEKIYSGQLALTAEQQATIKKMAMLANSVVFTSNGVNFMLAGEEFLRSKAAGGAVGEQVHNSYNASYKVNELDYSLKIRNADVYANYQKLIEFKQMFVKDFGLTSNDAVASKYEVTELSGGTAIQITITANGKTWKIIHANGSASSVTADFNGYTLYLSTTGATTLGASTTVAPYQTIIAYK